MAWKLKDYRNRGRTLDWGCDIPAEKMVAMRNGEVFVLLDATGRPYSKVLMDSYDTIREQRVDNDKLKGLSFEAPCYVTLRIGEQHEGYRS